MYQHPQLPLKEPQIPSNRDHKALNRGTLGGLGMGSNYDLGKIPSIRVCWKTWGVLVVGTSTLELLPQFGPLPSFLKVWAPVDIWSIRYTRIPDNWVAVKELKLSLTRIGIYGKQYGFGIMVT